MRNVDSLFLLILGFTFCNVINSAPIAIDSRIISYQIVNNLSGTLKISDSILTRLWVSKFTQIYPKVSVIFTPVITSSDTALKELAAHTTDLTWLGPDLQKYQEEYAIKKLGYIPPMLTVARGSAETHGNKPALAIFVNSSNPISKISLPELDAIFSATRNLGYPNQIRTWGDLGLTGEWAKKPIICVGMSINNQYGVPHGWVYYLMQHMLNNGTFRKDIIQIPDTAYGSGANRAFVKVIDLINNNTSAIGFSPLVYKQSGVKNLSISEKPGLPYYNLDEQTIVDGNYPLSQAKALAWRNKDTNNLTLEFLHFCLSQEGQAIVLQDSEKSLPLNHTLIANQCLLLKGYSN